MSAPPYGIRGENTSSPILKCPETAPLLWLSPYISPVITFLPFLAHASPITLVKSTSPCPPTPQMKMLRLMFPPPHALSTELDTVSSRQSIRRRWPLRFAVAVHHQFHTRGNRTFSSTHTVSCKFAYNHKTAQ